MTRNIQSLTDKDIDNILDTLARDAKPLVKELHKRAKAGELTGTDAWYQVSYPVLTLNEQGDWNDFVRVIAYAYSWLPRNNPTACPTKHQFHSFSKAVKATTKNHKADTERREARTRLFECTNKALGVTGRSSMVTASKVLHFWNPALAPMFDSRVSNALVALNLQPPKSYLDYWIFADRLIERAKKKRALKGLTYRRVDELLFQIGKETPPKSSKADQSRRVKSLGASARSQQVQIKKRETKMASARRIYAELLGSASSVVKRAFVDRVGLTPAGANTYYYKLSKE